MIWSRFSEKCLDNEKKEKNNNFKFRNMILYSGINQEIAGKIGRKIEKIPDNEFKKLLKEFGGAS